MAGDISPTWVAIRGVREGLSANKTLEAYRAAGGRIGRQAWLRLYSQVDRVIQSRKGEATAPLDAVPGQESIRTMASQNATGYMQVVDVRYRIKGTSVIASRSYSVRTDSLITRQEAVNQALDTFNKQENAESYEDMVTLGAFYVGTVQFNPQGQ